jgi:ankyrin repeat protein
MTDHEPRDELQKLKTDLLVAAVQDNSTHMVEALALNGAAVDLLGRPLCIAARNGNTDIVDVLVRHGADVSRLDFAPFRFAAECGHLDTAKRLLEYGSDVTAENHDAYRRAKANGHADMIALLRKAGSYDVTDPNDRPDDPRLQRGWKRAARTFDLSIEAASRAIHGDKPAQQGQDGPNILRTDRWAQTKRP